MEEAVFLFEGGNGKCTNQLQELLAKALNKSAEETIKQIERPKQLQHGDYAFPCFTLAKEKRQSPQSIATELATELSHEEFSAITAVGGYVNFTLDKKLAGDVLKDILQRRRLMEI